MMAPILGRNGRFLGSFWAGPLAACCHGRRRLCCNLEEKIKHPSLVHLTFWVLRRAVLEICTPHAPKWRYMDRLSMACIARALPYWQLQDNASRGKTARNLSLVPILHVFSKSSISVHTLEFAFRWRGSKRSEHHITKYITGEGGALFAPPFFVDGSIIQA